MSSDRKPPLGYKPPQKKTLKRAENVCTPMAYGILIRVSIKQQLPEIYHSKTTKTLLA